MNEVIIEFIATSNSKNVVNVKSVSIFKFDNQISFSEIPNYFYKNSLAIAFPYVRAFVSNLTLQSNTGVIMLGLINFTNMEEFFIKNTIAVSK
jgi:preprotein translocase subunit SecB